MDNNENTIDYVSQYNINTHTHMDIDIDLITLTTQSVN